MKQAPAPSRPGFVLLLAGLVAILLSAGCGAGSGQGLDEDGNLAAGGATGGGGGVGASGNRSATLAWVQANVFGGVCSQCHTGASAPMGVNWSSSVQTCANVGRPSGEKPPLMEIAPGDPEASYVIWKVEGRAGIVGGQMPLNNSPLTAETIQNMRDWIADGVPGC